MEKEKRVIKASPTYVWIRRDFIPVIISILIFTICYLFNYFTIKRYEYLTKDYSSRISILEDKIIKMEKPIKKKRWFK